METIAAKELDCYVGRPGYLLIDLRTCAEFSESHLRGAVNAPEGEFGSCLKGHGSDVLVLYCDRGAKSMAAARELEELGWRTKTVVGGIRAYRGHNLVISYNK
ncbi:MAG: rhodanese-like domain-containing protein [Lachnospiraceae bacterium]|nr:rhodanese-like domain-containing protein [Lachnospiraceae bacterium]